MLEQKTRVECVNQAERIRNRALLHVQRTGDIAGHWRMANLSFERIRDTSDWEDTLEE